MITQCRTLISGDLSVLKIFCMSVMLTVPAILMMSANVNAQETIVANQDAYESKLTDTMNALANEMAVIRVTQDPQERMRLMEAHQNSMREALILMRGMGGEAMQTMMSAHLGDQEEITSDKKPPVHRHKQTTGGSRTEIVSSQLIDIELRLDMMQVVLESLAEQCATP